MTIIMKRITALLLSVLLLFSFAACGEGTGESESGNIETDAESANVTSEESSEASIIGSWECVDYKGAIYTFNTDGTGSYTFEGNVMNFTYTDNGDSVELKYETATVPSTHNYTVEGDRLLIEDSFGSTVTYKKNK